MTIYGERLQALLDEKGKDRAWVCLAIGISTQAVGQLLSGTTKSLKADNHEKLVRALGCNGYWLATGIGQKNKTSTIDSNNITAAVSVIADALIQASPLARKHAKELIEALANDPNQADEIGRLLTASLDAGMLAREERTPFRNTA